MRRYAALHQPNFVLLFSTFFILLQFVVPFAEILEFVHAYLPVLTGTRLIFETEFAPHFFDIHDERFWLILYEFSFDFAGIPYLTYCNLTSKYFPIPFVCELWLLATAFGKLGSIYLILNTIFAMAD